MTLICIAQGTTLGLAIGLARVAEARYAPARQLCRFALRWPATVYVSFFRGTPLFVQILLIHFAVMPLFVNPVDGLLISGPAAREIKQNYGAFLSGVVALTMSSGAYISEIFRAGIQSIDRGQIEASRSLGMPYWRTIYHVVLPQAFRRMLPPLGNNAISLLKDSSLISAIGLAELAYAARTVAGAYSRYWEPHLTISLMYWMLKRIDTQDALRMGLINEIAPTGQALEKAHAMAQQLLACAPLALEASKQVMQMSLAMPNLDDAMQAQYPAAKRMLRSQDAIEGPLAFSQKRTPQWTGS